MAKKKVRSKFTEAEYWHYRLSLSEIAKAEKDLKIKQKTYTVMDKDIEIQKLKLMAYREVLRSAAEVVELKKKEHDKFKTDLEKDLGMSLENKMITEDFSIKEIED